MLNVQEVPQRRPRSAFPNGVFPNGVNGLQITPLQNTEQQVEGTVNAKNRDGEAPVWLEIRDTTGRLWRTVPQSAPDAQAILVRQIQGLSVGTHVMVRVSTLRALGADLNAPLPLLAIIPVADGGDDTEGENPPN